MRIVIICGKTHDEEDKFRFLSVVRRLIESLSTYFDFGDKKLSFLSGGRDFILRGLEELFIENADEDICLFYIGHGGESGIAVEGYIESIIDYEELGLVFTHHNARLIMINDCCYALAAEKAIDYHYGEHLLITSSTDRHASVGGIVDNLIISWRNGRIYKPKVFIPYDEGKQFSIFYIYDDVVSSPNLYSIEDGSFVMLRVGDALDDLMINFRRKLITYENS